MFCVHANNNNDNNNNFDNTFGINEPRHEKPYYFVTHISISCAVPLFCRAADQRLCLPFGNNGWSKYKMKDMPGK